MTNTISGELLNSLKSIDRPIGFCVSERVAPVLPGLEVNEVGTIGLPINDTQAKELIHVCHQAPYGKGEETLVDTGVRRVWALDPDHFKLSNPQWTHFIEDRVKYIQKQLGLEAQNLESHLYQLLLYEPGSFFLSHQDGEKLDGMVATLVVILPSIYEGGELIVRHGGKEETLDFSGPESAFNIHAAAFYSDCEHEIKPVRSGYRLSLVYNVTLAGASRRTIKAPEYRSQTDNIAKVLKRWQAKDDPEKLVVLLNHEYTEKGLAPDLLKGTDRSRVQALFAAASQAGCKAYLVLLTLYELGAAEGDDCYGGYGSRYDESEDYEMGEIFESSLSADHWTDPEGNRTGFGELEVEEAEVVSEVDLTDANPEEEFEGYTGNAGMELQRWYRHGAVILWSEDRHFDILCGAGNEAAIAGLQQMVRQWQDGKENNELKQQHIYFAQAIMTQWPKREGRGDYPSKDRKNHDMANLLKTLDDPGLVTTYIGDILISDGSENPKQSLAALCKKHGWLNFKKLLKSLLENSSYATIERNFTIFESLCLDPDKNIDRKTLCIELAPLGLKAIQRLDSTGEEKNTWYKKSIDRKAMTTSLFKSLQAIGAFELLMEFIDHIIEDSPKHYDLTTVQIPVLIELAEWFEHSTKFNTDPNGTKIRGKKHFSFWYPCGDNQ